MTQDLGTSQKSAPVRSIMSWTTAPRTAAILAPSSLSPWARANWAHLGPALGLAHLVDVRHGLGVGMRVGAEHEKLAIAPQQLAQLLVRRLAQPTGLVLTADFRHGSVLLP